MSTNSNKDDIRSMVNTSYECVIDGEEIYRKEQLTVVFTDYQSQENWCNGVMGDYWFEAKQFDEGSCFGINEGRVSKLHIRYKGVDVVRYDRGWDKKAISTHRTAYKNILNVLEEAPLRW